MTEVADIIKNASVNSLIILDEIGRGTSTFDGMSIARAVLEYIADPEKLGAKTLFSTHYHELTVLEDILDGVKNYNVTVKNSNGNINFLRKIMRGGSDDSYGVEVAKLAGLPDQVIERAREILCDLESTENISETFLNNSPHIDKSEGLIEKLKNIDIDALTPIEALNILSDLRRNIVIA
jgi:DNA mismatch repair protein MutS